MRHFVTARRRTAAVVFLCAAMIAACTPTAEGRYKELRTKIAEETAALLADRPLNSIGEVSQAEIEVVALHITLLKVYADSLEAVPVEADLQECRDNLVRVTRDIVEGTIVELVEMGPAYGEMVAVLKLC